MTPLQLTLPVTGVAPAILTLPQPLTPEALGELTQAVTDTLGMMRRDLRNATHPAALGPAPGRGDDAEIEYASWLPDPGAIEMASWTAHLQAARR
jgi:hypothetical protein